MLKYTALFVVVLVLSAASLAVPVAPAAGASCPWVQQPKAAPKSSFMAQLKALFGIT